MSLKISIKLERANLTERRKSDKGRTFAEVATEEGKILFTTMGTMFDQIPMLSPVSMVVPVEIEQWGNSQMLVVNDPVEFQPVK